MINWSYYRDISDIWASVVADTGFITTALWHDDQRSSWPHFKPSSSLRVWRKLRRNSSRRDWIKQSDWYIGPNNRDYTRRADGTTPRSKPLGQKTPCLSAVGFLSWGVLSYAWSRGGYDLAVWPWGAFRSPLHLIVWFQSNVYFVYLLP